MLAPVLELEHLSDEFDIHQSTGPALEVGGFTSFFQTAAHATNFFGVSRLPRAVGAISHRIDRGCLSLERAVNHTRLTESLALPKLSTSVIEISAQLGKRRRE